METSADRILVHSPNWIGDQLLAYPFFYTLRKLFPQAYIGVIAKNWVAKLQYKNLVNTVITSQGSTDFDRQRIIEEAKKQGPWDLGFTLSSSFSSAWMLRKCGVKKSIGYDGQFRSLILSRSFSQNSVKNIHRSEQYLKLLSEFSGGLSDSSSSVKMALMNFKPEEAWGLSSDLTLPNENYWILAPGSQAISRRWHSDLFFELACKIYEKTGIRGYVIGGDSERAIANQISARVESGLVNFCGEVALSDLWQFFKGAKFTISNDSGLAHLSSLCGTRTHIVWGAGNPDHTKPLGPGNVTLSEQHPACWPCEKNTCSKKGKSYLACLTQSSPTMVFADLQSQRFF